MSKKKKMIETMIENGVLAYKGQWSVKNSNEEFNSGEFKTLTEDQAYSFSRDLMAEAIRLGLDYKITLLERFTNRWVHAWDSSRDRVANPKHSLFFLMYGTDCDGMRWSEKYGFENMREATLVLNEVLYSADGPTKVCTISIDQYEEYNYTDNRDRYAEAMGY